MDKLTVFVIVILLAVVRGLLQRRQVAKELEQRLAMARSGEGRNGQKVNRLVRRTTPCELDDADRSAEDLNDEVAQ